MDLEREVAALHGVKQVEADWKLGSETGMDLLSEQTIGRVVLYNRVDCCGSRLRDITVSILDAAGNSLDGGYTGGQRGARARLW